MSPGKYVVQATDGGDRLEVPERSDDFAEALRAGRRLRDAYGDRRHFHLLVYNDQTYDVDDGVWNDGLTEDEREAVEALEWETVR